MGNTVVYQWLRKDGSPYYIGIGNLQRPYTGRRRCGTPPPKERIVILHKNLEWEEACEIEKELIAFYGRKDLGTGILRNLTDGGEGTPGVKVSEKTKRKMSENNKGKNNPNYGKKHLEETKKKISRAISGKNNHNYGKNLPEEVKKKISESNSGKNNPRYTTRNWYHPAHGEVLQKSISDLVKMFP